MLGLQVLPLVTGAQLQAQVDAAARSYGQQLVLRYPDGVPAGTVLGDPGPSARPGAAASTDDGTLDVPAITGPVPGNQAVTAVVAVGADGTVLASSAPSRYPPGSSANELSPPRQRRRTGPPSRATARSRPTPRGTAPCSSRSPGPPATPASATRRPAPRDGSPTSTSRHAGRPGSSTPSAPGVELGQLGDDRLAGVLPPAALLITDLAGRRAVRAARLLAPRPPDTPPGTSHPRGRRRRLHRHPARLRPGRGRPARGELHQHDQAA